MSPATVLDGPVQLTLRLLTRGRRGGSVRRPYWREADLADIGGLSLRARRQNVRVRLDLACAGEARWLGFYDAVLPRSGCSGRVRVQPTRHDALVSAAHALARHCRRITSTSDDQPRDELRAAREVLSWLDILDLL